MSPLLLLTLAACSDYELEPTDKDGLEGGDSGVFDGDDPDPDPGGAPDIDVDPAGVDLGVVCGTGGRTVTITNRGAPPGSLSNTPWCTAAAHIDDRSW